MTYPRQYSTSIAATETSSTGLDLKDTYERVYLEIPTVPSASDFYIQGSADGTTYRRISYASVGTSSVQLNDFRIASATSQRMVEIPAGFRYLKIEASTANATALTFNFVCKPD